MITPEMRLAGCRILYVMESPTCARNEVVDNREYPDRDLLLKVFAGEITTAEAIYTAMERAK